jgi:hypothetical protein
MDRTIDGGGGFELFASVENAQLTDFMTITIRMTLQNGGVNPRCAQKREGSSWGDET